MKRNIRLTLFSFILSYNNKSDTIFNMKHVYILCTTSWKLWHALAEIEIIVKIQTQL